MTRESLGGASKDVGGASKIEEGKGTSEKIPWRNCGGCLRGCEIGQALRILLEGGTTRGVAEGRHLSAMREKKAEGPKPIRRGKCLNGKEVCKTVGEKTKKTRIPFQSQGSSGVGVEEEEEGWEEGVIPPGRERTVEVRWGKSGGFH